MATSSILESVRLSSPKAASMFVDALEESASMPRKSPSEYKYHVEKNPEAIRRFVSKNLPKEKNHQPCGYRTHLIASHRIASRG